MISGTLLALLAPKDPEHRHRQLCGSSTIFRKRWMDSLSTSRRGMPKMSQGGSSMWIAILMPVSRQVGMRASRKYFRFSHSFSLVTGAYFSNSSSSLAIRSGSQPGKVMWYFSVNDMT